MLLSDRLTLAQSKRAQGVARSDPDDWKAAEGRGARSRQQKAGGGRQAARRGTRGHGDAARGRRGAGEHGDYGEPGKRGNGDPERGRQGAGERRGWGETANRGTRGQGVDEHRRVNKRTEAKQQPRITPGGPGFPTLPGTRAATACPPGPSRRHAGPHRRWSGMPGNCGIDSSLRWRGEAAGSPVISSCTYPMARYARRRRSNIFSNTGTARST